MTISPNPNTVHHPGGGSCSFTFTTSVGNAAGETISYSWTNGDTGSSTTFSENAPASDEADGSIGVLVTASPSGRTASDSSSWFALGF